MPKAVILCGGLGTRIRDANESLPKPMLPIGNMPILWHIMKIYAAAGVTDFVLCLGYKGWVIKEFFLNFQAMTSDLTVSLGSPGTVQFLSQVAEKDWKVTLVHTGDTALTGSRLRNVWPHVENEPYFHLTYGDGVADVDVKALEAYHLSSGRAATVTAVRPPGRFGELQLENGAVTSFNEKPQTTEGFINGGFFVLDQRVRPYLGPGDDVVFERQPLQALARDEQLGAHQHTGFWQPMDTLREFNLLNEMWTSGRAPWKVWP